MNYNRLNVEEYLKLDVGEVLSEINMYVGERYTFTYNCPIIQVKTKPTNNEVIRKVGFLMKNFIRFNVPLSLTLVIEFIPTCRYKCGWIFYPSDNGVLPQMSYIEDTIIKRLSFVNGG